MDNQRFDDLTRRLASGTSRRRLVRGMVASAVAGVVTRFGGGGAEAQACRLVGQTCNETFPCCGAARCSAPDAQGRRFCRCTPALTNCDGRCRNLQVDENNCGACGRTCLAGQSCCNGTCISTVADPANCGACGRRCGTNENCCSGECVDVGFDRDNCSRCGRQCLAGDVCKVGRCCTDIYASCNPAADRCCGASTCTGLVRGERTCCATAGLKCGGNGQCCSGVCNSAGVCA